jgi:hypothetical protein
MSPGSCEAKSQGGDDFDIAQTGRLTDLPVTLEGKLEL